MKSRIRTQFIPLFILSVFMLSSCGDIGITKRRHMPGYHVDFVKNKKKEAPAEEEIAKADKQKTRAMKLKAAKLPKTATAQANPQPTAAPSFSASVESQPTKEKIKQNGDRWRLNDFFRNPVGELRKEKLNGELTRAVFNSEEDKHGWSILSFISTGLGVVGLALVITGLALLVSFIFSGGIAFWWVFGLLGLLIGIAAMVTGIISMRQTGSGGKRGKGFAIAGMVSGIVSLVLGAIGLFWGLIYWVINNAQNNN